jgi:hypothetical protein
VPLRRRDRGSPGCPWSENFLALFFQAVQQGTIKCNFSGVALGDSWISPVGKYGVFKVSLFSNLDPFCDFGNMKVP